MCWRCSHTTGFLLPQTILGGEINSELELPVDADISSQLAVAAAVDKMRKLPREFEELTEDMGGLAARAKSCGLAHEFLEYVMQHRASGVDTDEGDGQDSGGQQPEPE